MAALGPWFPRWQALLSRLRTAAPAPSARLLPSPGAPAETSGCCFLWWGVVQPSRGAASGWVAVAAPTHRVSVSPCAGRTTAPSCPARAPWLGRGSSRRRRLQAPWGEAEGGDGCGLGGFAFPRHRAVTHLARPVLLPVGSHPCAELPAGLGAQRPLCPAGEAPASPSPSSHPWFLRARSPQPPPPPRWCLSGTATARGVGGLRRAGGSGEVLLQRGFDERGVGRFAPLGSGCL